VRVLGFGTYDRRAHPRAAIQLQGLADLGAEVSELNRPLGFTTAERVAMLGKPWLAYRLALRLVARWAELSWRRLRGRHVRPDAVLVGYLGHFDVVLARVLFGRTPIVLDAMIFAADTAMDRGVRRGAKTRLLRALDLLAVSCASLVLVDTEEHAALVPRRWRERTVVAPVGASRDWFTALPAERTGPLRVVFYGLFTPLQGAPVIAAAIASLPTELPIEITLIGSGQDLAETQRRVGDDPRVTWHEWVEPEELPALVAAHDVCLGIFADSPKALRVTPNKVYQGAAAGCLIVTSDTAPQRRALGDDAVFVPPADADRLRDALVALASDPSEARRRGRLSRTRAEERFLPRAVARPLADAIEGQAT
jgi:glycosyltransferase involved in cell wall biosynthesis